MDSRANTKYYMILLYLVTLFLMGTYGYAVLRSPVASAQAPVSTTQVTTGPPVVENGQLEWHRAKTVMPGIGRGWIVYTLTNEDTTCGIRCEYGSTTGEEPRERPTTTKGSFIAPGVSLVERTAPSNRLDCIAVCGNPKYDITMYPK